MHLIKNVLCNHRAVVNKMGHPVRSSQSLLGFLQDAGRKEMIGYLCFVLFFGNIVRMDEWAAMGPGSR